MFRSVVPTRQIDVLPTKIIKPASPTPCHLKRYNLSSMDQFSPSHYIPIVFYYPNKAYSNILKEDIEDKSRRLKRSLSEILVQYYPFAGRLNSEAAYVDCNDEGVEFQEVNVKLELSKILEKPDDEALGLVIPNGLVWGNVNKGSSLLVIRVTNFECGGISIAVCLSHKLSDGQSFSTFMYSWATKMRTKSSSTSSEYVLDSPHFISYPSNDDAIIVPEYQLAKKHRATRRFLFPNSKIARLKEMVNKSSGSQNTTRVEVLSALLYKCATSVTTIANSGFFGPNVLALLVNMRPKMIPSLPEMSVGNLYWPIHIPTTNESENNLNALVEKIKKGKMEIGGMKNLDAAENLSMTLEFARNNYNFFLYSSLCRMQFHQVDFGWGNPSRVTLADAPSNNTFFFMDTPTGDGIEALVSLEEQNMVVFQHDEDIVTFSSFSSI